MSDNFDLFELVKAHMGWDDEKTRLWFETPNPHCGTMSPIEFLDRRPEKAIRFIRSLIDEEY